MTVDMEESHEMEKPNSPTMLTEESDAAEGHAESSFEPKKQLYDVNHCESESNREHGMENGVSYGNHGSSDHEDLLKVVIELRSENEFLKSQFNNFRKFQLGTSVDGDSQASVHDIGESENAEGLERIESLNKELQEERQTRYAAEEALKHLQMAYAEADAKVVDLSEKLAEAQQKLDQEIKEREGKYSELDSKFSRLHKRAKQRIQDIQKEKDDLEAQCRELNDKAERALSQQKTLEQDLERSRQQANEALKAMDGDRQQLRSANNKLRDTIEELRRSLQPKESEIEELQQSLLEKELMLEDMRGLLQAAEEKRQASIVELSAKHRKNIESLEAQLNDALSDRSKATETISSLQVLVAEKESKIAEMEAASTGEAARLRASVETVKGELAHLKEEHDKEKESWETACQALKMKLEVSESNCIRAEIEAEKMRCQMESEASGQSRILSLRESELSAAKEEIIRLGKEFSSYKVRAHALLQKKETELAAAKDSEQLKALEEALKEAEEERLLANSEMDKILQELKDAKANHDKELMERNSSLENAKQQIKNLEVKLDATYSRHQREKEAWGSNLQTIEETWRIRCEALKAQNEASSTEDIRRELEELKLRYKKLKEEHDSFRDLADRMMEEKDGEISRLLDESKSLRLSLESKPSVNHYDQYNTGIQKKDASNMIPSTAEQQILLLARQQAQREEELAQSQRHILALQEEIEELERDNLLHSQQEAILKTELRNMERMQKREGVDMTYLKNVILKLLETGEAEALLPVVGMLLQFSPDEMQKCQQAYRSPSDVSSTTTDEASGSGLSIFSRFSFT